MLCPIGVLNERDKDRKYDVNEQSYKDIEVDLREDLDKSGRIGCQAVRCKHVITINEGEETFRCDKKCTKLHDIQLHDSDPDMITVSNGWTQSGCAWMTVASSPGSLIFLTCIERTGEPRDKARMTVKYILKQKG